MTLAGLSLAYLRDRTLNTALNILILTFGVAMMVILVLLSAQLGERLQRDAQGIDLVVGAKGSPLQLILSSIYQVDAPTGNIPLDTVDMLRRDPTVAAVIPLAQGDSFRGFRITGTEPAYVTHYGGRLRAGRMWAEPFETVIGAQVARSTGATIGQKFMGTHGLSGEGHEHEATPFVVVGVLAPTGTVLDRLVLTSVESVWDVHGIEHGHEHDHAHAGEAGDHGTGHEATPLANASIRQDRAEPEVTALLVTYRSPLAAVRLPNFINQQTKLQAAAPATEIARLFTLIGVGYDAARGVAILLIGTSGLAIFVALYSALRQREGDMALLRVMGARPAAIFAQITLEGVLLATAGALLGLVVGHGATAVAGAAIPQLSEMGLTGLTFEPAEIWIVLGAVAMGGLAAIAPAARVFSVDIAETLQHA